MSGAIKATVVRRRLTGSREVECEGWSTDVLDPESCWYPRAADAFLPVLVKI